MEYLDKIKEFVYQELNNDYSGHDYYHALRVLNNAKKIMLEEKNDNINDKIIYISSLIHDCIDHKLFCDIDMQIKKIIKLLKDILNENEINEVLEIIQNISFSKNKKITNINAQIVCDADRLDALGAIGIIRTIEFGAVHNRKFDNEENATINHFYEKLLKLKDLMYTDTGKTLANSRHQFMKDFLKQYYLERGDK